MAGEARFTEIKGRLEALGYELVRIGGSHHVFAKPGAPNEIIPVHRGKVKPVYVRKVEKLEARQREQGGS